MNANLDALRDQAERSLRSRDYKAAHEFCVEILRRDLEYADAYFLLAMLAAEHGNYVKAAEVFRQAVAKDDSQARYHAALAKCLVALYQYDHARAAIDAAMQRNPEDAHTLDTVGVVLTRLGAYEHALEYFELAVAGAPKNAEYCFNLASTRQFLGRFDEARRGYRDTLRLNPDEVRAWSALSQLWGAGADDPDVERLKTLFTQKKADADACLHIGHALARHYEQRGDYAASLGWLHRAKVRKRESVAYDVQRDQETARAAMSTWQVERKSSRTERSRVAPVFIVGMPRTGTTLVDRILSSHPQVVSAGELGEFSLIVKRLTATESARVLDAETLQMTYSLDATAIATEYVEALSHRVDSAPFVVDKMPFNLFYAGVIHWVFPDARIICLRRSAMDACLSNYRQLFSTRTGYYQYAYDLTHTAQFYAVFDELANFWRTHLPSSRYTEVRYESLVASQEAETRRLLTFCGLPWDGTCLDFQNNRTPVATASSVQVREPLYSTSIARWRRYGSELDPMQRTLEALGINTE